MNFWKLPLRKNSTRKTFVNTKIFFLSVLPINCGFQHEYLTSVLLWVVRNPIFYLLKSLGCKKHNVGKKINLIINAFLWKKWLLKKRKKLANVCKHKNMCIPILNMHADVCDIRKLSNPFNYFYNTLVKLVLQYSKCYEFFWLATYQFIH